MASARYDQSVLSSPRVTVESETDPVNQSVSSNGSVTVNVDADHDDQSVSAGDGIEGLEDRERRLQE